MSGSDRRGFLKDLLRAAAETAQEVRSAIGSFDVSELTEGVDAWQGTVGWEEQRPVPAAPTTRTATLDELERLCEEAGIGGRAADARRLARVSVRLTPRATDAPGPATSRLGGAPDVPPGFSWPRWDGEDLVFLGQVSLAELAALDPAQPLPREGLLLLFYAADRLPDGLRPGHRGSARALVVPGGPLERREHPGPRLEELPVELSLELTLPGAWSSPVEPLELEIEETAPWEQLRERLAALQGVELEELAEGWRSLHRLLGYPDELRGEMGLDCQLASHGLDLADGEGYVDDRRAELEDGARDWRLLFQVSDDDRLAASFGEGFSRLYVWIRDEDLQAGSLDGIWAILQ